MLSWTNRSEVCNSCFVELPTIISITGRLYYVETFSGFHSCEQIKCVPCSLPCQEKEQSDFTMTLLDFKVPRQRVSQYCICDFSLGPDTLCPVGWALCLGQQVAVTLTPRPAEHESYFFSLFIPLYLSFYPPPAHCKQWFPFYSFFYLPMCTALIGFPLDQTSPSPLCCWFIVIATNI